MYNSAYALASYLRVRGRSPHRSTWAIAFTAQPLCLSPFSRSLAASLSLSRTHIPLEPLNTKPRRPSSRPHPPRFSACRFVPTVAFASPPFPLILSARYACGFVDRFWFSRTLYRGKSVGMSSRRGRNPAHLVTSFVLFSISKGSHSAALVLLSHSLDGLASLVSLYIFELVCYSIVRSPRCELGALAW